MCGLFAPSRGGIALAGGGELDALPTRLQVTETNNWLLTLYFRNASNALNRSVAMDAWTRILPEAMLWRRGSGFNGKTTWGPAYSLMSPLQLVLFSTNRQATALFPPAPPASLHRGQPR